MLISIVGGGIAGLTTAIALDQIGLPVKVFEAAEEIKPIGAGLILMQESVNALESLRVSNNLWKKVKPYSTLMVCDKKGELLMQLNNRTSKGEIKPLYSITRSDLYGMLVGRFDNRKLVLGKEVISVNTLPDGQLCLKFNDDSQEI